jgi:hypothetical protein
MGFELEYEIQWKIEISPPIAASKFMRHSRSAP